jgi:hypothetical protein
VPLVWKYGEVSYSDAKPLKTEVTISGNEPLADQRRGPTVGPGWDGEGAGQKTDRLLQSATVPRPALSHPWRPGV